jgi:hypothetical protein
MQVEQTRNKHTIQQLYNNVLPALAQYLHRNITPVIPLFDNFVLEQVIDTRAKDPAADAAAEVSVENGNVRQMGLKLRLEGFRKGGVEAFDMTKDVVFMLEHNRYTVGPDKDNGWLEMEYGQRWTPSEYEAIAERWSEELVDELTQKLENLAT